MHGTISKAQTSRIWACAHELGLNAQMLYHLVPRGSISALSRQEAAELIECLEKLKSGASHAFRTERTDKPRAATLEQRNFIYFLFGRLGWIEQPERMRGFLQKYAHVASVEEIPDSKRASAIIEALKAMNKRVWAGKL